MSRDAVGTRVRRDGRGFTLLEVILAVSILAVIVVLATAALRVGLRAWESGQRRANLQQENRALVELVSETLAGASPYRGRSGLSPERVVLF
jgi:general secretion pathway protein J